MKIQTKKSPDASSYVFLSFAIFSISTASIFIRFAQSDVPSLVIAAYRLTLAALVTAAFLRARHITEIKNLTSSQWLLILLSGLFHALHFATWITSLEKTSIASSVVLVTTTPIWVAVISPFLLEEKISRKAAFYLGIAFIGSLVVTLGSTCSFFLGRFSCLPSLSSGLKSLQGNLLALIAAWLDAAYILAGKKIRGHISTISYTMVIYLVASILLISLCFVFKLPLTGFKSTSFLWLVLLAIIPQLCGHSVINQVLGILPASIVSIALLGEPLGTSILALIFMGITPSWLELIGGGIILFGIFQSIHSIRPIPAGI